MSDRLTTVVVPAYNHAHYLPDCLASLFSQTSPVEIILVDDGSTDSTDAIYMEAMRGAGFGTPHTFVYIRQDHAGPCAARNRGLEQATGEFVMFLDADDVLHTDKVANQIAALDAHPEMDWCLCDTLIRDEVRGKSILASENYNYKALHLNGWIFPQLQQANVIPIMAPLVRRSILDGIRFDDRKVPEDWFFWMDVARAGRVCYIPYCGAIYEHRRTGRSRIPKAARRGLPGIVQPLRLNLGCGTPGTRSWHPMPGLVNLDKSLGWRFEDGLGEFADGSVAGVSVSHALMYLPIEEWGRFFNEVYRVLKPGGVIRVTEDSTFDPKSSRVGGWKGSEPAVTLTSPELLMAAFSIVGLEPHRVGPKETFYDDASLIQQQHGDHPDVFFVEGVKHV